MECEYCHREFGDVNTVCLACGERTDYYSIRDVALGLFFVWASQLFVVVIYGSMLLIAFEIGGDAWMSVRITFLLWMGIIYFILFWALGPSLLYSCRTCKNRNAGPVYSCPYCNNIMVSLDLGRHYIAMVIGFILVLINMAIISYGLEPAYVFFVVIQTLLFMAGLIIQVMRYSSAMIRLRDDLRHSSNTDRNTDQRPVPYASLIRK